MKNTQTEKKFLDFIYSIKSIEEENMIVRGVIGSDDSLDRHGDRVNPKGWNLKNFKKNPVILLNHNYWDLPIAKALNVKVDDNKLLFDIQFSKTYDVAVKVFNLIKEKIVNATSVGFIVLKWGEAGGQYTIEEQELLELSFVTVPANPNALTQEQLNMVKSLESDIEKINASREKSNEKPAEETKKDETITETKETKEIETKEVVAEKEVKKEETLSADQIKELIKSEVEKQLPEAVNKFIKVTKSESDEDNANDPVVEALLAMRQELKSTNKESGKTLKAFNAFIEKLQK